MTHRNTRTRRSQAVLSGCRVSSSVTSSQILQLDPVVALGRKKTPCFATGGPVLNGAGEETRTLDVHLGKVVLYQLSYTRRAGARSRPAAGSVNSNF